MRKRNKKVIREANRSGKLPCDICNEKQLLVRHHLNGREIPGAEEEWNISWICSNDHENVHSGIIIVEGWFVTDKGRTLIWHKKGEQSITGMETNPHVR
jgi:hypothetical protein